ncbi:MAG: hypothetical protein IJR68_03855 [Fretibacterium sp.]|nr:hypothetical protein [Fretibacterium sp.]
MVKSLYHNAGDGGKTMDEELWRDDIATEDEGPALPGWNPTGELPQTEALYSSEGMEDIETAPRFEFEKPGNSTLDMKGFIRPATPEQIEAYKSWKARRAEAGLPLVIDELFQQDMRLWDTNPKEAARRMRLERETGIARRMMNDPAILSEAERRSMMAIERAQLQAAPERVVQWLSTPGMMEIARDDIEALSAVGRALERYAASLAPNREGGVWQRFQRGISNVLEGWSQRDAMNADVLELQSQEKLSDADAIREAGIAAIENGDPFGFSLFEKNVDDLRAMRKKQLETEAAQRRGWAGGWNRRADSIRPESFLNATGLWGFFGDVAEGAPYTLAGMPGAWLTTTAGAMLGGPLGAAAGALLASLWQTHGEAETEQAQVYHQLVQDGMDRREAYEKSRNEVYWPNFALLLATNYAENMFSFGAPIVPVGPGVKGWVKGIGRTLLFGKDDPLSPLSWGRRIWNFALSSGMEGVEEIAQGLISNRALGQKNDWGELLYEGAVGVANGILFSTGGDALRAAVGKVRDHLSGARSAEQAQRNAALLDELMKSAQASETLKRTPEVLEDFVQAVTDGKVSRVTMDAETFMQVMGPEAQTAAEELGISDGLREALSTGGAVEISVDALMRNKDIQEKVRKDLRLNEDGMSVNEAEAFQKAEPERREKLAREMEETLRVVKEAGEQAARVQEGFRQQLEALGHKVVGKKDAELLSVLYTRGVVDFARAANMSIEEAAKRPEWNVRFMFDREGRTAAGDAYDQSIRQVQFPRVELEERGEYDGDDPATWPEGPARDEALNLKSWIAWDEFGEYEDLPNNIPEKAEALALMKEREEIEAWFAAQDIETVKNDVEHNERDNQIEKRLDEIDRSLKRQMPKKAERRLEKLIEAEAKEAEREFELYDAQGETETYAQRMFHGTRHNLGGRFDLLKIGTGEGAQVYGWGIYLAENQSVSETYRLAGTDEEYFENKGTGNVIFTAADGKKYSCLDLGFLGWRLSDIVEKWAKNEIERKQGKKVPSLQDLVQETIKKEESHVAGIAASKFWIEEASRIKALKEAQENLEKLKRIAPVSVEAPSLGLGNLYTVEGPENDVLLDYDRKLSQQPEKVKEAIKEIKKHLKKTTPKIYEALQEAKPRTMTGEKFYVFLSGFGGPKKASEFLNHFGIPGLRYFDQTSRSINYGTHNFVIWNTDMLKIMGVEGDAAEVETYKQTMPNIPEDQTEAVRKRYEGTPQWMKAPNGKDTKLTEKQWLQVRTPAFKQWFGDWEAVHTVQAAKDFLNNSEPVGKISGNEFSKADTSLLDRVAGYYKETGNETVNNKELGDVKLDRRGIKDSMGHGMGREKAAAYALVPDVIKNGFVYAREQNWKGRGYDTAVMIANVQIGGKDYVCEVVVKRTDKRQGVYLHEVELKDNLDSVFKTAINGTPSGSRLIISQYAKEANNSSKVVDENGEPLAVYHGTHLGGFSVFNTAGYGKTEGTGAWFTSSEKLARGFARDGERKNNYAVYLNFQNPCVVDCEGRTWKHAVEAKGGDLTTDDIVRAVRNGEYGDGYDGVVFKNVRDGFGVIDTSDEYVALNPEQIKSATDNRGTFDAGDADIYHQDGGMQTLGYTTFADTETVVRILKNGNRSTLLHELGHVFLNSRRTLALMEGVENSVREDWTTLAKWLDIEDIDFSKPLSEADRKRWKSAHEKFAAGFEKYLMEGTAPSTALAKAFRTFRKWLKNIYRAVKNIVYIDADGNAQKFELSDDVRAVMDRMLASEDEIEQSRAVRDAAELAQTLKEQGIPDDVAARYQDKIQEAEDKAKARLMKKLTAELKQEKQEELKAARKEAKKRIAAEVWEQPEYKALKALRRPLDKGGRSAGVRLSMPDLVSLYGDAEARKLINELPFGVVANDGLSLDVAASLLGYPAGDALIEDLKKAQALPPAKAISERVKAETAELESLANNPEALRGEAERALHGKERAEWLAMEAAMLGEAAGKVKEQIAKDARQEEKKQERERQKEEEDKYSGKWFSEEMFSAENLAAWTQAAEETAKRILAGKRMRDISPARYLAAEKRAAEKALRAAGAARFEEAYREKRTELLNHALAAEALRVREEYEAGRKYLEKFWSNRKRLRGAMGNAAFDQIIGLLARVGVNQENERAKDRPRLGDYLNGLPDDVKLAAPQWLLDMDVKDSRLSLANLTMEDFFDVWDLVKRIEHVGRMEKSLIAQQEQQSFEETVNRLETATMAEHGAPAARSVDPDEKGKGLFGQFLASLDRVETLLRKADGLKELGVWWETFYRPAQRAFEAETKKAKEAKAAINALYRKHFPNQTAFTKFLNTKMDTGLRNPKDGKKIFWTGENLLSAMLNWGNQHNRERLVFGNGFVENALGQKVAKPADEAQYQSFYEAGADAAEQVFAKLGNDNLWEFCQDVWDLIDTFWPEIRALEEKMTGVAPEKVEALPVKTAGGKTLRGGYYPVKFDARLDWSAFVWKEKENVRALYEDQFHRAGTRHGHTKERVERVAARPLSLSLNVIPEHIGNVIHDLTHRPVVRDLNKLIRDDRVRTLLIHAVGQEGFRQFNPWVEALANPATPTDPAGRVMSKLMGNAAAVGLGFNVISMVGQTVSLVPAAWKLGPRAVLPAIANTLTLRGLWDAKFRDWAFKLSPELADRINGTDRDIRAALDMERSGAGKRLISGAKAAMYMGLGWVDMAVSLPVWSAAYDQGMKKFNDQRKAIDYADYIVRTTNNTGAVKDLAAAQRGTAFKKLFTMYYSAFGSMYQMFSEEMTRAGRTGLPGKVRMAAFCFLMFSVQAALEDALKGRAPWNDDDDDKDGVLLWMLKSGLGNFSSMFPIWRDVASGTKALGGFGEYRGSPALDAGTAFVRGIDSMAGALKDIWDGEDAEGEKVARDVFKAGGYAFGLPTIQILRWYKTFCRWMEDAPDFSPLEIIWTKRGK